jgi:ADP-ribosylglycohydrolase
MMTTSLSPDVFRDKVFGCWMGKNAGGTLGAPLETTYGQPEPFDIWWYPRLEEGGIPNDDLELQLIWLLALEEVGPAVDASDLIQYWLDYVGYNWDEYGFHKVNLRLGLEPPVSSVHNNWFKDCMGCPIRSEIWACIAPGYPHLAVRYAYEDAIIDHAGGEGLYGELFNAAIQSAAFVLSDPRTLIDIGLTYVPEQSQTFKAVQAALAGHAAGDDWKQARRRVMEATPHYNTQYAPLNMGFQVVGWLYGSDFGDAICKAVNCGYDTDCTGATLGSYIGIVDGNSKLPAKWLEPLGTVIATNASWGGLRNLDKGLRPVPKNTVEFTDRTIAVAHRVLDYHGLSLDAIPNDLASLKADAASRALLKRNPWQINHRTKAVNVGVEYPKSATIATGATKRLVTHLENPHPAAVELKVELQGTPALSVAEPSRLVALGARSQVDLAWDITAVGAPGITNRLNLVLDIKHRPALPTLPIVLLGVRRWRFAAPISAEGKTDRELFDTAFSSEIPTGPLTASDARPGPWREADAEGNAVPFPEPLTKAGVIYAQAFTWSPTARAVRIGAATNTPVKVWLNGKLIIENFIYRPHRPNSDGQYDGKPIPYVNTELQSGWNELLFKYVRGDAPLEPAGAPFEADLILCDPNELNANLTDQIRNRFPWE